MTLEEFKRPYSEAELRAIFEKVGLDELAWDYCKESYVKAHKDFADEYCKNCNDGDIDELIADLKAEENWDVDTVREYSWQYVLAENKPTVYISQRKKGHGHAWSMIYTDEAAFSAIHNAYDPLKETYLKLHANDEAEANLERDIFIDSLSESKKPIFKKALTQFFRQGKTIEEDIDFARGVAYQYDRLLESGCKSDELYNYAKDLAEDRYDIYYRAYRIAINNEASSLVARSFADKIAELQVNGYLITDTRSFCMEFKKVWQREFYYTLVMEDANKRGERWLIVDKNLLRTSLGLSSLVEPLTAEDKEYLRIKQDLMANGMNEISADRKAHEVPFCTNTPVHPTRSISASEQLKLDMDHMMYPNEEDYQDYIDGEI